MHKLRSFKLNLTTNEKWKQHRSHFCKTAFSEEKEEGGEGGAEVRRACGSDM
jgi:hypothetical protein